MFAWLRRDKSAPASAAPERAAPGESERMLRRLEWTVIRRLDGVLQGDYRMLFRGMGLDLADVREYQPHDDVRHVDWNVTARTQMLHVREFQEDREVAAWFLVDLSGHQQGGGEHEVDEPVHGAGVALRGVREPVIATDRVVEPGRRLHRHVRITRSRMPAFAGG